jgi:hypothetical protein
LSVLVVPGREGEIFVNDRKYSRAKCTGRSDSGVVVVGEMVLFLEYREHGLAHVIS